MAVISHAPSYVHVDLRASSKKDELTSYACASFESGKVRRTKKNDGFVKASVPYPAAAGRYCLVLWCEQQSDTGRGGRQETGRGGGFWVPVREELAGRIPSFLFFHAKFLVGSR